MVTDSANKEGVAAKPSYRAHSASVAWSMELLAFSRLGRQALHLEPVDMRSLVREVWDELLKQEPTPAELELAPLPLADAGSQSASS